MVVDESQHVVNPGGVPLNPENGHYYEYIESAGITWTDAKIAAESRTYNGVSGHLATITTPSENASVNLLLSHTSESRIGLSVESTEGTYQWVNGEPFAYSIWLSGIHQDSPANDYLKIEGDNGRWEATANYDNNITGYVVEYDVPNLNPDNGHY